MTSPDPRAALADELEAWPATGRGDGLDAAVVSKLMKRAAAALRSPTPFSGTAVTDEMVTAAMREFERMSAVLRYREKDKWHSCDIMGMRDALRAAFALLPDPSPYSGAAELASKIANSEASCFMLDAQQKQIVVAVLTAATNQSDGQGVRQEDTARFHGESLQQGPDTSSNLSTAATMSHGKRSGAASIANPAAVSDRVSHTATGPSDLNIVPAPSLPRDAHGFRKNPNSAVDECVLCGQSYDAHGPVPRDSERETIKALLNKEDDRPLPTYGQISWKQLGRDVHDSIYAMREDWDFGDGYPGHKMLPTINFNSLARIVDKYRWYGLTAALPSIPSRERPKRDDSWVLDTARELRRVLISKYRYGVRWRNWHANEIVNAIDGFLFILPIPSDPYPTSVMPKDPK